MTGLRIAWLDMAAGVIPPETLARIPNGGFDLDVLAAALRGTRYEGAAQAAQWVWGETNNFLLDHSDEDGVDYADPWDMAVIEEATAEWRDAQRIMVSVGSMLRWLEQDMPGHFREVLDFALERVEVGTKEAETDGT